MREPPCNICGHAEFLHNHFMPPACVAGWDAGLHCRCGGYEPQKEDAMGHGAPGEPGADPAPFTAKPPREPCGCELWDGEAPAGPHIYARYCPLHDAAPDLRWALGQAEHAMDTVNGRWGADDRFCCFCHTTTYNAEVGIEHQPNCAIVAVRDAIRKAEG